ncbi:hypothetical protein PC129_g1871 [Phytophthora cactorum]|uniref:Uncharacterized protein n=1 Tax=Phytophthora cactorum TaxID=29920 RepID=A0A329SRK5_9STRA|nr:hypothetical protein PC112_g9486 [Phytophthora cactorum]KAG2865668.1 hypothetical protein PC113_g3531 [Phytophthora cactorum]KAG2926259.1 hypothetical protein PC114_g3859 [Phytophthora cactorum]KAG2950102.1 hypothetical protein PC117_g4717 [Phytophthora cactorum]KAG2984423.1 hypothetical protein PC118_g8881 [Phytophthora cactorum]
MGHEKAALVLEAVVDKFGMYLAFKEGRKGQLLARHSVMQYYRQAKNWLLDQFPQHRAAVDKSLLKKGQVLERHCMKRVSGTSVNKAPACTKKTLKQMAERASDLTLLRKANLSIRAGGIFFVRFIRVKTSEEHGLSLFPDSDFALCPLLAIALALVTHSSPTLMLLNQIPEQQSISEAAVTPATPLIDLIDHPEAATLGVDQSKTIDASPGIHSYVNRILQRVVGKTGVAENLTSQSFRRGGAHHANGTGMCVQWIFDRGAWNMTSTNKAFTYVFNTPAEDHKVAGVLSGHDPEKAEALLSLDTFDSETQAKIRRVASALFGASTGPDAKAYNVNARVVDTIMAYLLLHYPSLKWVKADGLAVQRIESCAIDKGFTGNKLLAWSSHRSCTRSR